MVTQQAGSARSLRVGVDIGGTFTDLVIVDDDEGSVRLEKTPTTPGQLSQGILRGLDSAGISGDAIGHLAHGTTVGINTLLQRRGARTGLLTTKGFRDAYEIGRGARPDVYNLHFRKPQPLVPRERRLEVDERLAVDGQVVRPLDEASVRSAMEVLRRYEVDTVAVCLIHAYVNPAHERRVAEIVREGLPDAFVCTSHELVREWREYERTSTTCVNAYIMPRTGEYIDDLITGLEAQGYANTLFVNQSAGGVMSATTAKWKPVGTLMSGPSGGAAAAAHVAELMDLPGGIISFDMGGTSTDVAVIEGGTLPITADAKIDRIPVMVPMMAIESIGAGGGSIGKVDEVGALDVGPQSAGAEPGPACYGGGGELPTVTDADLLLGRLPKERFLPGQMSLDEDAARKALDQHVGEPLGLTPEESAAGIVELVNLKMAMAVRSLTVERGLDPRDFSLFAFGGAGPMHACAIAEELGIPKVIVPLAAGQFSALGILMSDIRHDFVRTAAERLREPTAEELSEEFGAVEGEARGTLEREGVAPGDMAFSRSVDLRYAGQEYTVNIPVPSGALDHDGLVQVFEAFHSRHQQVYSHSSPEEQPELVNLRVAAIGRLPSLKLQRLPIGSSEPGTASVVGSQSIVFDRSEDVVESPVYDRASMEAGNVVKGPCIIADMGSTTVVPPTATGELDEFGNLVIHVEEQASQTARSDQ
ncbi:hydantoinase/oxoprolinase family protein [Egibacter rhizosphaerae]|uniref:Hydantoinase/oxoprolinase family protein n=1 Tax=Egibacter rhizosphaerae TaxID=1670831 RepID=A0A411YIE2_9ACTN|nr:hydantoinase/oxoprolinase family protein [Egibacter rhizosphaerae]QBI20842.1 hydantoinase/oxoprolinase family protein [Egibacter rhizosphaerae]